MMSSACVPGRLSAQRYQQSGRGLHHDESLLRARGRFDYTVRGGKGLEAPPQDSGKLGVLVKSFGAAFILLFLSLLGFAFAQTPVNTAIQNTATATYTNAANQSLTATSNTVTTTVLPIYRFEITPNGTDAPFVSGSGTGAGQSQTGAAGGTVVFTYQLENQGNTANNTINLSALDSATDDFQFGTKTIYLDNPTAGIQGQLDPQDSPVTSVTLPYNSTPVTLFVEAAIPGTAVDNQVGRLNLSGASATGGETDANNWAELAAFTNAALTLNKTATGNVIPGGTISYTVSGANTGGTNPYAVTGVANISSGGVTAPRDGILVSDVIPAGLSYVPGSLTFSGSNTASTTVVLYSTNGGTTWVTAQPASGVNAVGVYIGGTAGQRVSTTGGAPLSYSFTFNATAPAGATAGTVYNNTGTIRYDSNGDSDGADAGEVVTTTPAPTTVDPSGTFAVGPYTFPTAGASGSYTVTGEGYTVSRTDDAQTIASAPNEREVSFRHTLGNATNFGDTFTLSSTLPTSLANNTPPGSVSFYAVNGDGSRGALITAPLAVAAGATADFYTVVTLPADYTSATPLDFTVTATSTQTGNTDTTIDTISEVTEAQAVDIGNYAGNGTPNNASIDFPAQPGSTVSIPLIVRNNGADPDTFGLSAVIAPPGYTVTIYGDDNCNGRIDGPDTEVSSSNELEPGTFECFILQVTIPTGAAPATYDVTVTATSQNDPNISDFITDTVTVGLLENFTFTPTPQAQATSSTVPVVYTHTITNNSNEVASVDLTFTEEDATAWTYEYSLTGADGSYTTTLPTGISVAANGGTQAIYVRVTPDPAATEGTTDAFTLTATPTYGATTGAAASVTDTTTIDQEYFGQLDLDKTVSVNGGTAGTDNDAEPGDTLTYTVTATNLGAGALNNVQLTDAVPANTTFVSATATAGGGLAGQTVLYSTNGTTWSTTPPSTLATGSIYVGVSTNGDNNVNANDSFPADGVLTLTLVVTID